MSNESFSEECNNISIEKHSNQSDSTPKNVSSNKSNKYIE